MITWCWSWGRITKSCFNKMSPWEKEKKREKKKSYKDEHKEPPSYKRHGHLAVPHHQRRKLFDPTARHTYSERSQHARCLVEPPQGWTVAQVLNFGSYGHCPSLRLTHHKWVLWKGWTLRKRLPVKDACHIINESNGYRPQGGQGWNQTHPYYQGGNSGTSGNFNQPSLRDLVYGQWQDSGKLQCHVRRPLICCPGKGRIFSIYGTREERRARGNEFGWAHRYT